MTNLTIATAMAACMLVVSVAPGGAAEGQTNALNVLKAAYGAASFELDVSSHELKRKALAQYGKALDSAMASLQQKGDLDGFLAVKEEKERFAGDQTVPDTADALPVLADAARAYNAAASAVQADANRQSAALLRKYVGSLDELIKQLVRAGNIEEAKAVKVELEKATSSLASVESRLPADPAPVERPAAQPLSQRSIPKDALEFDGHHYLVVRDRKSWRDARAACAAMGGHLLTISNEEEWEFADENIDRGGESAWIGLTCEGWEKKSMRVPGRGMGGGRGTLVATRERSDFRWVDGKRGFIPPDRGEEFEGKEIPLETGKIAGGRGDDRNYVVWSGWGQWVLDSPQSRHGFICEWDY